MLFATRRKRTEERESRPRGVRRHAVLRGVRPHPSGPTSMPTHTLHAKSTENDSALSSPTSSKKHIWQDFESRRATGRIPSAPLLTLAHALATCIIISCSVPPDLQTLLHRPHEPPPSVQAGAPLDVSSRRARALTGCRWLTGRGEPACVWDDGGVGHYSGMALGCTGESPVLTM